MNEAGISRSMIDTQATASQPNRKKIEISRHLVATFAPIPLCSSQVAVLDRAVSGPLLLG